MSLVQDIPDAGLGGNVMGTGIMGQSYTTSFTTTTGEVDGHYRAMYGWGFFGKRVHGRGYEWTPLPTSSVGGGGFASITLTSSSGSIIGKIRTDVQRTIIREIKFTIDQKGCAGFEMKLNQLPDFKLTAISQMSVNIGNTDFEWFTGQIEQSPEEGTFRDEYVYKGFGLRKQLQRVTVEKIYSSAQDIGLIIEDIAQNYIAIETTINYNAAKITTSTGVLIASNIDISKANVEKVLDSLSNMCGGQWGVDGDGDFYFELKDSTVIKNWYVGYDVMQFNPDLNTNKIKNSIFIKRQVASGGASAGWAVASIANDATSQAKFGIKELQYQMPGYFSDADCDLVSASLLAELKDPKFYGKVKDITVDDSGDYIERGVHRFINTATTFDLEVQDCEDITDWTKSGAGDLTISNVSNILISGAFAMKLAWSSANSDVITAPIVAKGGIKKLLFYIRADRTGQLLTVGIGNGSYLQNTRTISIDVKEQWIQFEWDISALNLTELNEIGFVIDDSSATTNLWLDAIEIQMIGSKHYSMELTRADYVFSPNKQAISSAEFGPPPERMYDYVSGLIAQSEENKFTGEQR